MKIQYPALAFLAFIHLLALAALPYLYFYGLSWPEAVYHIVGYFLGGLGITALYHRAWTHNSVTFARPVEYALAVCSILIPQMPAKQWMSTHILHHHHVDTQLDPYNIKRGFWWAHFEWIILAPVPPIVLPARLHDNPVVEWQEKNYYIVSTIINLLIPIALAVAAGAPWWGGALVSALRLVFSSHVVYSVNSVCHKWGTRAYSTRELGTRRVVVPVRARRAVPQLSSRFPARLPPRRAPLRLRPDQMAHRRARRRWPRQEPVQDARPAHRGREADQRSGRVRIAAGMVPTEQMAKPASGR